MVVYFVGHYVFDRFISSCNIGEGGIALAEAVHGSAPDIAGKVNDFLYIQLYAF